MPWRGSSDSGRGGDGQGSDLDVERGARAEKGVEQVLAGGPLAVHQVGAGAAQVVANDVSGQRGDRGTERGTAWRDAVGQVDAATPGQYIGRLSARQPDQGPPVGEIDPGHQLA